MKPLKLWRFSRLLRGGATGFSMKISFKTCFEGGSLIVNGWAYYILGMGISCL